MAEGQTPDGPAARRQTASAGERRRRRLSRRPRSRSRPVPKALRGRMDRRPTTIWPWPARPASARAGWPAPSARKPAATIAPSSIIAGRSCARTWRSPGAMGDIRALSNLSAEPTFSSSTTSASSPSTPAPVTICSKSSRSGMDADRRSSPHSSRCPPGTRSSATPRTQTPFWTASCTTRIASNSPARACAAPEANNPKRLDLRPRKGKKLSRPTARRPGRDHLVTGGRHHPGIPGRNHPVTDGRLHRNRHPIFLTTSALDFDCKYTPSGVFSQI